MVIHKSGRVTGGIKLDKAVKARQRMMKYAADFIKALFAGKVPQPGPGDCWYCFLRNQNTGQPAGECGAGAGHIEAHIRQRYYVPSLLMRATEVNKVPPIAMRVLCAFWGVDPNEDEETKTNREATITYWGDIAARCLRRSLRLYLGQQLGLVA